MSTSDFKLTSEKIELEGKGSVTVFTVQGWLDAQSEEKLVSAAVEDHAQGTRHVVVNLKDADTVTSAGIRALQKIYLLYNPPEHTVQMAHMKLCNAQPQVYHVLSITGFLQSAPNYETLQAALDSFFH